ncbi:hypothetical protein [Lysobacter capsici]|uniref:hypothetical protein n=1 Tax=Lysobacter capsici TaxID=435897 RepID=UPI001C00355D|nr:hypothetical protein [Lysobacter capsici]QWF19582.1 hypothetical protein KME82_12965 [Lysobacter capsici]
MTQSDKPNPVQALPSVSDSGQVELDWERSFQVPRHGPLYELPRRGPVAKGEGIVVSMDATRLQIRPQGDMSSGLKSMLLSLGLLTSGVALWFSSMLWKEYERGTADQGFVVIMLVAIVVFAVIAIAALLKAFTASHVFPTLFNRISGKVVQLQGGRRIEANWSDLVPRVEIATAVTTGGAVQYHHLYLVEPADEGKMIMASAANNGQSDCLAYYEFLRRYMAAEWTSLPDTVCLEGARRPLLRELSANLWTQPTNYRPWQERSTLGKALSALALLAVALLWWPVLLLTLIGSRIGATPGFSAVDLGGNPQLTPNDPEAALPVRPAPAMGATEQGVYAAIAVLSTAAWCWPGVGVLARVFDLVRQLP